MGFNSGFKGLIKLWFPHSAADILDACLVFLFVFHNIEITDTNVSSVRYFEDARPMFTLKF